MGIKDFIYKLKISEKNPISPIRGLKGYSVGNKLFSASIKGQREADIEASKLFRKTGKANIHFEY